MTALISGAVAMAALVIALFFLRFWKSSGDRFFLYFALSFAVQAIDRVYAALPDAANELDQPLNYLIRVTAYVLILWAIFEKNLPARRKRG